MKCKVFKHIVCFAVILSCVSFCRGSFAVNYYISSCKTAIDVHESYAVKTLSPYTGEWGDLRLMGVDVVKNVSLLVYDISSNVPSDLHYEPSKYMSKYLRNVKFEPIEIPNPFGDGFAGLYKSGEFIFFAKKVYAVEQLSDGGKSYPYSGVALGAFSAGPVKRGVLFIFCPANLKGDFSDGELAEVRKMIGSISFLE